MKVQLPLLNRLTFKSKLILLTLFASVSSILVIAGLGAGLGRWGLRQAAFSQLRTQRAEKHQQVQAYFQSLRSHTLTLSIDRTVVSAMVELNKAFRQLDRRFIPAEWNPPLKRYYEEIFFPQLASITGETPLFGRYRPSGQAARYLQHYYLVENTHDTENKHLLISAEDESEYSRYHETFHPLFSDIVQQFDYADLYLINHKTGDIVYSANKLPDYGTNLETDAYRESALADLVETVRESSRGEVAIADFQTYEPANGVPSLLIASPIYNGPYIVGILAIRVEADPLNRLMTGAIATSIATSQSPKTTLESSLDSYLIGADGTLRSAPLFYQTYPERYTRRLRRQGIAEDTLDAIARSNSPILLQSVNTEAAEAALSGTSGVQIQKDYRGVSVLTAYGPLESEGLSWAMVSQLNTTDVFAALTRLELAILVASILLITAFTFLAIAAATYTIAPIRQLNAWADQVVDGDLDAELDLDLEDEIGQLTDTLQIMVTSLSHQVATLDQKMMQNKVLLANLVPPAISKRLKRGESPIADQAKQVTVLYANLVGIVELSKRRTAAEVTELLTKLMALFDEAAQQYGMEPQHTPSTDYMALCGLTVARLDHTKRTVDFALELQQIINRPEFSQSYPLGLRLVVHTGSVTAGVVGTKRFSYSLWGESIELVTRLYAHIDLNQLILTRPAYERVAEAYTCVPAGNLMIEQLGMVETWVLATREKIPLAQVEQVQTSFSQLVPQAEHVGQLFYQRLLESRPDFRVIFQTTDTATQASQLMEALAVAVESLRNPEKTVVAMQTLSLQYKNHRLKAEDYDAVETALLWALEKTLGDDFSREVQQSWRTAFQFWSNILNNIIKKTPTPPDIEQSPGQNLEQNQLSEQSPEQNPEQNQLSAVGVIEDEPIYRPNGLGINGGDTASGDRPERND